jgi:hypothetical protein
MTKCGTDKKTPAQQPRWMTLMQLGAMSLASSSLEPGNSHQNGSHHAHHEGCRIL